MKRIFTLLTLLVTIVTGAWAADFTVVPVISQNYANHTCGLVKWSIDTSKGKISSSSIQASNNGNNVDITFTTTKSDMYIKTITFGNLSNGSLEVKEGSSGSIDGVNFTGDANQTSVVITLKSNSGKKGTVQIPSIVINAGSNDVEELSDFSYSSGTITAGKVNGVAGTPSVTMTTNGGSASGGEFNLSNSKYIQFTSDSRIIKYIAFNNTEDKMGNDGDSKYTASSGTYSGGAWSGSEETVQITNGAGGGRKFDKIYVITESSGPADPTFTLTKSSIGANETSQIQVGTTGDLDGITLSNIEYGTPGVVTVNETTGVVTPEGVGTTTITFNSSAVADKYNEGSGNVTITVTAPVYAVTYELNGGAGDAPTQAATAAGENITLAAAPSRDCYTFAGWLCDADDVTYAAGADYTMTAAATTFTAQWTPLYASGSYIFENNATVGTAPSKTVTTTATSYPAFRIDNMFFSTMTIQYEDGIYPGSGDDFKGWKIKTNGATIKFQIENDQAVTIGVGNLTSGANVSYTALDGTAKSNVALTAKKDNMFLVKGGTTFTFATTGASTVTLKKIAIADIPTATITTNAGKWASFTPSWNCTLEDGATAYFITEIDEVNKVVTGTAVDVLEAGQGYFVKGEAASTGYTATATDLNADATTGNMLVGCLEDTDLTNEGNTKYFLGTKAGTAGLYYVGAAGKTIPAGKCYLQATSTNVIESLSLPFEEVTAVQNVEAAPVANKAEIGKKAFVNGQLVIFTEKGYVNAIGQTFK